MHLPARAAGPPSFRLPMEQNEGNRSTIDATPDWPRPGQPAPPAPPTPSTWTVPAWPGEEKAARKDKAVSMRGAKLTLILRALLPLLALTSSVTIWVTHRSQNGAAWHVAQEIGLRQSDFPLGATVDMTQPPEPYQLSPSAPGPCSPVHSQPWIADYDSPTFDPSEHGDDFVSSEVVIMRTSSDAYDALAAIGAPGYGRQCFQPAYDEASREMMPDLSCGAFHFEKSSITEMPHDGFPEAT